MLAGTACHSCEAVVVARDVLLYDFGESCKTPIMTKWMEKYDVTHFALEVAGTMSLMRDTSKRPLHIKSLPATRKHHAANHSWNINILLKA